MALATPGWEQSQDAALQLVAAQTANPAPGWASEWEWLGVECSDGPGLEVHRIAAATYLLRQPLCVSFEAPIMVLLIGRERALLLDTGASHEAADELVERVVGLLPTPGGERLPLVVAHTHGHLDHRSGDDAFRRLVDTTVIGAEPEAVAAFWGLGQWPDGVAELDLGGRAVQVVAIPGHHRSSIALFDVHSGLLITGDSLLPGRVIIDDLGAFRTSVHRLAEFAAQRRVSWVVGAHVEMNIAGGLYRAGADSHPNERPAALPAASIVELQAAMARFGALTIRARSDGFVLVRQKLLLALIGASILVGVGALGMGRRWLRQRAR